jgi:hypothetical protein
VTAGELPTIASKFGNCTEGAAIAVLPNIKRVISAGVHQFGGSNTVFVD